MTGASQLPKRCVLSSIIHHRQNPLELNCTYKLSDLLKFQWAVYPLLADEKHNYYSARRFKKVEEHWNKITVAYTNC
jgi:hypothetical protein